jgi:hypothetical protein
MIFNVLLGKYIISSVYSPIAKALIVFLHTLRYVLLIGHNSLMKQNKIITTSHTRYQTPLISFLIPNHVSFLFLVLALLQYEECPPNSLSINQSQILFMVHDRDI